MYVLAGSCPADGAKTSAFLEYQVVNSWIELCDTYFLNGWLLIGMDKSSKPPVSPPIYQTILQTWAVLRDTVPHRGIRRSPTCAGCAANSCLPLVQNTHAQLDCCMHDR